VAKYWVPNDCESIHSFEFFMLGEQFLCLVSYTFFRPCCKICWLNIIVTNTNYATNMLGNINHRMKNISIEKTLSFKKWWIIFLQEIINPAEDSIKNKSITSQTAHIILFSAYNIVIRSSQPRVLNRILCLLRRPWRQFIKNWAGIIKIDIFMQVFRCITGNVILYGNILFKWIQSLFNPQYICFLCNHLAAELSPRTRVNLSNSSGVILLTLPISSAKIKL
jgi:hypothetical protein